MSLKLNLHHLEDKQVELAGELPAAEVGLDQLDEVIHAVNPLQYALTAQQVGEQILLRGWIKIILRCECVRCLKTFDYPVEFPDWICHLPLEGEEKVPVLNDCVDLTPYLREDILLEFPQHPLCKSECVGLSGRTGQIAKKQNTSQTENASAWSELNKLKF